MNLYDNLEYFIIVQLYNFFRTSHILNFKNENKYRIINLERKLYEIGIMTCTNFAFRILKQQFSFWFEL